MSIYTQCVPSAKGHTKPPATHPVTTPQQTTTYYTPTTPVQVAPPKPHHHTQTPPKPVVVKVHHQTKAVQTVLVAASVSSLDLGTGPTIFFALLLGTVLVLLGVGGARSWRNRHRV